jgi:hypothetical protein
MRKSEIKNILDQGSEYKTDHDPVLVFDKNIDEDDGKAEPTCTDPSEWDNVRHLSGNLYAAWDDGVMSIAVYLGHFE